MITPEFKDKVLKEFIQDCPDMVGESSLSVIAKHFNTSQNIINTLLEYYERRGLIEVDRNLGGSFSIQINIDAIDFIRHGGFVGQEELLEKNIQKLLLEIENLKPSIPGRIEQITSIAANITSALGLFIH